MKRRVLLGLAALFLFGSLPQVLRANFIVLNSKRLVLNVDDDSGNFYLEDADPADKRFKMLLFRDEPPTSYITLIVNGQPYRLNSPKFSDVQLPVLREKSITSSFRLKKLKFTLHYFLTNATSDPAYEALVMSVSVENRSENRVTVGARFLLDTVFNEAHGKPEIYLSSTEKMDYERLLRKEVVPEFEFNGDYNGEVNFGRGLFIYNSVNDFKPSSVIIGNWKKLDDNELTYSLKPTDAFKATSYANKDAAVAIFYQGIPVKPDEKVSFGILLSLQKQSVLKDFNAVEKISNITAPVSKVVSNTAPQIISNTLPSAVVNTNTNKSVPALAKLKPIETNKPAVKPETNKITSKPNTNRILPLVVTNTVFLSADTNGTSLQNEQLKLLQAQTSLLERMNRILNRMSSKTNLAVRVVTNVVTNKVKVENKAQQEALKKKYERKMKKQKLKYEKMMQKQKKSADKMITEYEKKLKKSERRKNRIKGLDKIDQALQELDQKIKVINELSKLDLDFETLPPEKIKELEKTLDALEKKVILLKFQTPAKKKKSN